MTTPGTFSPQDRENVTNDILQILNGHRLISILNQLVLSTIILHDEQISGTQL